jgi:hypothetical protein
MDGRKSKNYNVPLLIGREAPNPDDTASAVFTDAFSAVCWLGSGVN